MIDVKTAGLHFTIKLTPVSKKNSQQILTNPKTGRPFIMPSKKFKQYEKDAMWFIPKGEVIDFPVNVKCLFYMPTRRKCDLVNMQEAILDVMVKAGLLADDNYSIVQSMDGSRVLYDKENPRTEIYITEVKNNDKGEA
jgi:Holliday junction resolvase RusA-like endonuclease